MIFKNQSGARTLSRSRAPGQSLLLARWFRHQLLLDCQKDSRNRGTYWQGVLKDARMTSLKGAKSSASVRHPAFLKAVQALLAAEPQGAVAVLADRPDVALDLRREVLLFPQLPVPEPHDAV